MAIMNRIYHAKVTFCRGLVLLALTVMTLVALWWRWPLAALPAMLLLLWWIERLIHTTYTLTTDQKLLIDEGRFACRSTICLADVRHIQRSRPKRNRRQPHRPPARRSPCRFHQQRCDCDCFRNSGYAFGRGHSAGSSFFD